MPKKIATEKPALPKIEQKINNGVFRRATIWYGFIALSTLLYFLSGSFTEVFSYRGIELVLGLFDFVAALVTIALPFLYFKRSLWSYRLTFIFLTSVSVLTLVKLILGFIQEGLSLTTVAESLNTSVSVVVFGLALTIFICLVNIYLPYETRKALLAAKK